MIDADTRDREVAWLTELTAVPTASGREQRVMAWVERWVAERPELRLERDDGGNLLITAGDDGAAPLVLTAHMDHPAFVVESIESGGRCRLSFRGSVHDPYFDDARVRLFTAEDETREGRLVETRKTAPFRTCVCEVAGGAGDLEPGDVGRWDLPDPSRDDDLFHTHACDDLAALAAALAAVDRLLGDPDAGSLRVLLTRAEEIGFIGATAACKLGTIPDGARVVTLENSRSFAESPLGGGPIVRVGDRRSTFDPGLTEGIARLAEGLAEDDAGFRFQRRLMPGGTCESTVFCAYGFQATCLCLPLGNYHNQADLAAFETGENRSPRPAREFISIRDYHGLIDLLVACARKGLDGEPDTAFIERLYDERAWVLG